MSEGFCGKTLRLQRDTLIGWRGQLGGASDGGATTLRLDLARTRLANFEAALCNN